MQNVYRDLLVDMRYNKFIVGELLFIEYNCPISADVWSVWTETDFIIRVLRGKKRLFTGTKDWMIETGDTVYVKKGSFSMNQYFDDEFCMLGFFINDDFIRKIIGELREKSSIKTRIPIEDFSIKRINSNPILDGFFDSMYPYFKSDSQPSDSLLQLKLSELVTNMLTTDDNPELSSYFQSLEQTNRPSIRSVMENNFYHALSIEEYAGLSHRSLSTFKRDFKSCYNTPPGKWLLSRRLEYGRSLLQNKSVSVSEVAYRSGFESASHFSRSFKSKFGQSPAHYQHELVHR